MIISYNKEFEIKWNDKKFLNAYKAIVQKARTRGLEKDVTNNPRPQNQEKFVLNLGI